jgi:hypothetical protein
MRAHLNQKYDVALVEDDDARGTLDSFERTVHLINLQVQLEQAMPLPNG